MDLNTLETIEKSYRPIPFWSWNAELTVAETRRQIAVMDEAGIGGYFMHARGGLTTPYMGEAWFDNVAAGIEEGNKRGMQPWVYDENGWPSGFGNGLVNGLGLEYQQKYLRWDKDLENQDRTICCAGGYRFYFDVNPFYVDTLDGKVTDKFIEYIYKPYYDRFKTEYRGYFTDEPQISRNGIPWSFILPEEYQKAYGENLLEHLGELFFPEGNYEGTRTKFWLLVTKLFSANFMKKLYDWCVERNLEFTGHLVLEETLLSQLVSNGACMPHYEYFTMPGMDWLGRDIRHCLTPLQVSSVAHQLGKKEILSETFALCGHNVGFDELKAIAQWQMVNGITKLCPHLEGYSLEGLRKRDYPPAMYYQQPWWPEYGTFVESMSRIGKILSEGKVHFDTLLMHNQSSAWKCYDNDRNEGLTDYNDALLDACRILEKKHILFHLGDEIILERHGRVEGKELVVGTQRYTRIVLPKNRGFLENTQKLLEEFTQNGGIILTADEVPANDLCSSSRITCTQRTFPEGTVTYYINNTPDTIRATFKSGGKVLDIVTGRWSAFTGSYTFAPYDSLVLLDDGSAFAQAPDAQEAEVLDLSGPWELVDCGNNVLTIDTCDVYFDGELASRQENAADVLYLALDQKRSLQLRCDYSFDAAAVPPQCSLVCESPEKFRITVNGTTLNWIGNDWFVDKSFRTCDITKLVQIGHNVISMEQTFSPSQEIYDNLEKSIAFESEKNKLTFETEFESIYLIGSFSVRTPGQFQQLERDALRYTGSFVLDAQPEALCLANIEQQGFPFFAGRMTLRKHFRSAGEPTVLHFHKKGVNAVHVLINGIDCGCIMWGHLECDITHALHDGDNVMELTLVNNLRNMLGPHHLAMGESYAVGPNAFYKRVHVWTMNRPTDWNDDYCFVEFGLTP